MPNDNTDYTHIHTCSPDCPCHTGGKPMDDFCAAELGPTGGLTEEQFLAIVAAYATGCERKGDIPRNTPTPPMQRTREQLRRTMAELQVENAALRQRIAELEGSHDKDSA
jgi:hypothetical protein